MQNLKYYVLGTKSSPLLKTYLDKYYKKLLGYLGAIKDRGILEFEISNLLQIENRDFILNADNSSLINIIYLESNKESILILKKEINIFLKEGIDSINLTQNKGEKIYGTNIKLTDIDNNPLNKMEAHPDHIKEGAISGNWGEKTKQDWLKVYEKTFNLLKKVDSGIYDELNQIITKIVPLGTGKGIHNSASYKECIGHLYMGYNINSNTPEIYNLEAIIHESSHNKLNLLMQFDPIILNGPEEKYYSAIRPDARPIKGVFLGYHAFAPTMYIIMKAYIDGYLGDDQIWLEKIVLYHIKVKFLQKVIKKYAQLTELGKEVSDEIDYVIVLMDDLIKKICPNKDLILRAKKRQIEHFKEVNVNYPYLEY